jgi:hypothetical protein
MKQCTPKFVFGMVLTLAIVLSGFSFFPTDTTVEKIITNKDSFDGKEVSVKGIVSNLKFKAATVQEKYTTFILVGESGGRVNVFISERVELRPGQEVQVTGVYRKVRKTTHRNYYNEIEASSVK